MEGALSIGPERDLKALFDPTAVAVVGASSTAGKWGNWLARNALRGRHRRQVYLVNRSGEDVLGEHTWRSVGDLPERAELVVLAIGASGFGDAVEEATRAGARAIVGIAAGLGETGLEGRAMERRAVERVRAAGAVLLGPNCLGVVDTESELNVAFGDYEPGPVALVSQSGNLALEIVRIARHAGLGFSRFVSVGNQADLGITDILEALATHAPTRVIAVYAEDFRDGREFARAALRAREQGKPVVLLTAGASKAGARAARSHTGAIVSATVAIDAACRSAGISRAATPHELAELLQGALMPHPPRGRRLGVVGDGGGHVALAADLATEQGLELPELSQALQARISETLPPHASTSNPIDLAGGGEQDLFNYARVVRALHESGEVDGVLLTGYFGGYSEDADELARRETEVAQAMAASTGPLMVHSMHARSPTLTPLRGARIPVFGDIRSAVHVLGRLAAELEGDDLRVPALPRPEAALHREDGYFAARRVVALAGVELADAREARSAAQARQAAAEIGFPVVLKALGAVHKSESGGVRLGIGDAQALDDAIDELTSRLRPAGWSVERMVPGGVELLVGVRRDHSFGPVVVVGAGGVLAELAGDLAVALAPVSPEVADQLLSSLRMAPLLGRSGLAVAAAARAAAQLSAFAAAHPELSDLEVNPLLVTHEGAIALDARMVFD